MAKAPVKSAAKKTPARAARKKITAGEYVKRPSQATEKAPTKRLTERRKKALDAPKGYFPNPRKGEPAPAYIIQWKDGDEWSHPVAGAWTKAHAEFVARCYASYDPSVAWRVVTNGHKD